MANPASTSGEHETLDLTLRLAVHPVLGLNTLHPFPALSSSTSIGALKQRLEDSWDGKPKKEGFTVVKGGRVLRDVEVLKEVFEDEIKVTPTPELVLHVIVRPTAWSQPFSFSAAPAANSPSLSSSIPSSSSAIHTTTSAASPLRHPTTPFLSDATEDVLAATPLPSPGIGEHAAPPVAAAGPAPSSSASLPPTPTIRETPPTPVPTPPQREGYAPAYLSAASSAAGTALPAPTAASVPAAAASVGASTSPFLPYLSHLQRLIPLQRALLLLNLQKAHVHYQGLVGALTAQLAAGEITAQGEEEEAGMKELSEVEELFKGLGLWALVEQAEKSAEKEYEERIVQFAGCGQAIGRAQAEFRVVQLNGLPYLLHTPLQDAPPPPHLPTLVRLRRAQTLHHTLTTLLQLLITFQPSVPAIAHGRAGPGMGGQSATGGAGGIRQGYRPMQPGAPQQAVDIAALAAAAGVPVPGPAGAPRVRRAATLSITLNVDTLLSLLVPLFLLSLKLAFLLWIFGRHASTTKRIALGVMAALWVGWEGWRLLQNAGAAGRRRRAAGQAVGEQNARGERERQAERERRRAARAAGAAGGDQQAPQAPPAAPGQPAAAPAAGAGQVAAPPVAAGPQPRTRRRSPPPSLLSPKYWLNALAAVGLVAEARELGLQPRFIAGRPIPPAPPTPPSPLRRALRNVWVGIVLFFGTLSPEVERKRKKALEKRERLVRERREAAERQRAVEVVKREKEKEEREKRERAARVERQKDEAALRLRRGGDVTTTTPAASTSALGGIGPTSVDAERDGALNERVHRRSDEGISATEAQSSAEEKLPEQGGNPGAKPFWDYELKGERAVMDEMRRAAREREERGPVVEEGEGEEGLTNGEKWLLKRRRERAEKKLQEDEAGMRTDKDGEEQARGAFERDTASRVERLDGRKVVSDKESFGQVEPDSSSLPPPVASTSASSLDTARPPSSSRSAVDPSFTASSAHRHDEDDPLDLDGDASSASSTAGDPDEARDGGNVGDRDGHAAERGQGDEGEVDQVVALF
ncbi:hypothetical protein JCM11251_003970 [Rhodosporidiobolus azoricus]